MSDDDIIGMRVAELAAPATAVLFMWATVPKLEVALVALKAWGFTYATNGVWDKGKIGMGFWFRGQHEHLLVGRREKTKTPTVPNRRSSVFRERRTQHSRKPYNVREWINRAWPSPPNRKLELFAREHHPGWDVYGNEEHQILCL